MLKIIAKAGTIVSLGTIVLLLAGVWGENQMGLSGRRQLLHMGIWGTLFIVLALTYSWRKRWGRWGKLRLWLRFHMIMASSGAALILWHTGLRFHNVWGWLATGLLLVISASGVSGRYIYMEINREMARRRKSGGPDENMRLNEQRWRELFGHWRSIHVPLTYALLVAVLWHILGTGFYGGWVL
ncbi:MAG: hypothetical protein QMC95_14865 [Desulfitobacteriaceae bacterium]|nr:hypothetical protein [Desulfitobacteriaceae bacterium]MDI6915475.1 hypothetical protein [Desulfitobacteriaceae bacterium]